MKPHEIKPDTQLCTILGYNAQTGYTRKYFNKILKNNGINATAIALNIGDEHFDFTMRNVAQSKVDKMIFDQEFQEKALPFCDVLDETSEAAKALFEKPEFLDEQILFVAKMMLLANRWFEAPVDVDAIPLLIEN